MQGNDKVIDHLNKILSNELRAINQYFLHSRMLSDWPTFPQLFVKGELVGGCDIVSELHETKELESVLN